LAELCEYLQRVVERLPTTFGDRFYFDAAMIQGIARDQGPPIKLPDVIVPRYSKHWGYERVQLPSEDRQHAHFIHLIHFPGGDQLADVNLLDYPWLFHELAHCVLSRDDSAFAKPVVEGLQSVSRAMRLASIADRGVAKARSQKWVDEIIQFWLPVPGHRNWSHELATDMISLWLCGPVYLATFANAVSHPSVNPYKVDQDHCLPEKLHTPLGRRN
jgi:hypothetical protein